MLSIRTVFVCLSLLLAQAAQVAAEDRIFLFSSGPSTISVLRAADLSEAGSIDAGGSAVLVTATPDRRTYYVLRNSATDTLVEVDPDTLQVTNRISLGAKASDAVVTPDGQYLLVAAGTVRVFSTDTGEEVSPPIPVGGAPTQILVNNISTRAYVLSANSRAVHLIDLETLTRLTAIGGSAVGTINSIALSDDDSRLVVATTTALRQYRATDLSPISEIPWGSFTISRGRLHLAPGNDRALIENGGTPPYVTSLLIGLNQAVVRPIGDIGSTKLEQITILNETTAYAIEAGKGLVKIDFADLSAPTIELLQPGLTANTMSLSPNHQFLYASSSSDSRVTQLEIETNTITNSHVASAPPASHVGLFDPSSKPPARLLVHGGDNQYVPPGRTVPIDLSVRAVDADGRPVVGTPVLFSTDGSVPLQIAGDPISVTNGSGVAAVRVVIPSREVLDASRPNPDDVLGPVRISATAVGVPPTVMTVNVVYGVGLIAISGDYQVTGRGQDFPLPFVVFATDKEGSPLPAGTKVSFLGAGFASCPDVVELDPSGFASAKCRGADTVSFSNTTYRTQSLTVEVPDYLADLGLQLGKTSFIYNLASDPNVRIQKRDPSGDNQSGPSGSALPLPLVFELTQNGFFSVTDRGVGVEIRQISGPAVTIDKSFLHPLPVTTQNARVTLGPSAGTAVIEMRVSAPGLPSIRFSVTATGGQPQRLVKVGDGQSARIGNELANPLQVQVFNETNQLVPFPQVTWTVLEGDATIVPSTTPTAATARVLIGNTPGTIRIQARAGSLTEIFLLEATPPQPVSISSVAGQNQTLTTGALSEPLMVVVNETNNRPANGVLVTFSGPPNVTLHSLQGDLSGNPLQLATDGNGTVGVRAELLASAALSTPFASQFSNTITVTASAGADLTTTFLLNVIGQTPTFTVSNVLNAASFQPGVVPGSLVSIFGTGLSEGVSGTVFINGDTSYEGTSVRIGSFQAPLISITGPPDEQINVQVPFELAAGIQTTVEVENNGTRTTIGGVASFASQPGIFTVNLDDATTIGAVLHAMTGALVTPENPAAHGEPVSMFITGGGRVNPAVLTGVPAPPGPAPLMVEPVVVGVDNKGSELLFSGYAPGFIGLYQINFRIPEDSACGLVPLNIRVGSVVSPRTNIAVACPQ